MADTHTRNQGGQAGANQVLEVDLLTLLVPAEVEGMSVRELVQESGMTRAQVTHRLRSLMEAGEVELAGERQAVRPMDGRMCRVPVYRLKSPTSFANCKS